MIITPEQLAHLKEHEAELQDHQRDPNYPDDIPTVEQWVDEAEEDEPYSGYYYMCLDLGLDPLTPHPEN